MQRILIQSSSILQRIGLKAFKTPDDFLRNGFLKNGPGANAKILGGGLRFIEYFYILCIDLFVLSCRQYKVTNLINGRL